MFDVDWSDPSRESVGDRRARKQRQRDVSTSDKGSNKDNKRDEHSSQASGSGSVRSSMSSVDKQFVFFGGKNRKKGRILGNNKLMASSSVGAPTIQEQDPADKDNQGDGIGLPLSLGVLEVSKAHGPEEYPLGLPGKPFPSFSEAVFNKWDESPPGGSLLGYDMASPKPGLKTTLTQDLGDGVSSITKISGVASIERGKTDTDYLVFEVIISAGPTEDETDKLSVKPATSWQPPPQVTGFTHGLATVPEVPSLSNLEDAKHLIPMFSDGAPEADNNPTRAVPMRKPKAPLKAPAIVPASQQYMGNPELWKAPEGWEYSASEPDVSPIEEAVVPTGANEMSHLAIDLASMQREATRLLGASPQVILLRLTERWGCGDADGSLARDTDSLVDDSDNTEDQALVCKEAEMEKTRWMLSALHHMESKVPAGIISKPRVKPKVQRVLSLFDSQATTSYLAISNPSVPVYHLSPDPLPHIQYPNIHPMMCPAISASAVGVATESFSAVNCLRIASILPSSDLPKLLQNIYRVLAPGGFLNMVIIDPLPSAASAGPMLRQWLDDKLIFNLEQRFRCTNPSRNFPVWLQEARLRAKGSIITTTRFQAISPPGGTGGGDGPELAVMKGLRAVVGRMLWREIWGPFVAADRWWWETPEIVDECLGLGTHWEYNIIAACKESDA